ncbi:MAG: dihydropteroate synthase [Phycisphaerae bacterium]
MRDEYKNFIKIGESVHASIPSMGKLMREVFDDTDEKAVALNAIKAKIIEQAEKGASYIDVNVDDYFAENADRAAELMRTFVTLVAESGCGIPACIDSSNDELVIEGLRAWYSTGVSADLRPMVNSIKPGNMDVLFPLAKDMPYVFIALMMTEGVLTTAEEALNSVLERTGLVLDTALASGFTPSDIYYDTAAFPIAIDLPMNPGEPGRTWLAFESIKAMANSRKYAGVHFSLGISNCFRNLPGPKLPITVAYLAKACEYGLDAGIVNVCGKLFDDEPQPELLELVDSFAKLNGDADSIMNAMTLITNYCSSQRK